MRYQLKTILMLFITFFTLVGKGENSQRINIESSSNNISKGKYHAIIISVNNYHDSRLVKLDEPKNDADKLTNILTSKYFFNREDIIRLIDPSRSDIYDAIEQKTKSLSIDDNLIVFYAGHGYWDYSLKMGYWLPSDSKIDSKSNWVSNNELALYLSAIQANHILLISDACFSGGIFKARSIGNMDLGTKRLYELKSRKGITSGNLTVVPDTSVFMKFFLKELELNESVFLTTDQLFAKIRPNIINNSTTEPLYGVIHNTGDGGGEFVFYNTKANSDKLSSDAIMLSKSIINDEKRSPNQIIKEENKILNKAKRVAIINFDNSSGKVSEYGDLGGPLRQMLTSDLEQVKNLTIVERQALEKVLNEQNLNNTSRFDQSTATKLGKLLGVEIIITGNYFEYFGSLRVDAKFINVETGEISLSVGVDGSREKLIELKNSLANKIIEKLK
jgi:TolB-like protein